MNHKLLFIFLMLIGTFLSSNSEARQPYHATITVGAESARVSDPNLRSLTNDLRTTAIEQLIPIYTPTSAVSIDYNLRGIEVLAAFALNSTTLTINIPQLGINTSFTASTREESLALFKSFIKENANNDPNFLKIFAKYSPIDPIAGNPNSLMAIMAQGDYQFGNLSPLSGCDCYWSAQPILHQFQVGLNVGRGLTEGFETTTITLPLRYSYSPDGAHALIIDMPITLNKYDGAYSLAESLGFGFRIPITYQWSLTPTARIGFGGSADLQAAGVFVSTGLISNFNYSFCDFVLSVTNQATYFTSTNLYLCSINCDYHMHNFVFKNGFAITSCQGFELCGRTINYNLTFVDSAFVGDALFIEHYDEVGASLITTCLNPCIGYDCLSVGFAYQFGQQNYKGYQFKMTYQF